MNTNPLRLCEMITSLPYMSHTESLSTFHKIEVLKNRFLSVESYFDEVMKPLAGKGGLTSLVDKFTKFGLNPAKKISEKYLPTEHEYIEVEDTEFQEIEISN